MVGRAGPAGRGPLPHAAQGDAPCWPSPCGPPGRRRARWGGEDGSGALTAGRDVAAGVGGVDLGERVGAVLRARDRLLAALPGLADDAAAALQAHAVLAVELKVLPELGAESRRAGVQRLPPRPLPRAPGPPARRQHSAGRGTVAGVVPRVPRGPGVLPVSPHTGHITDTTTVTQS